MEKLSEKEVQENLAQLDNWNLKDNYIQKDFEFKDFLAAMNFINELAKVAERLNHHPDWSNSYNKVHINLTSHDTGGLTKNDFIFAKAADEAAKQP
jgi:4a-hydroxytetrahydrobiopterin dehydratase